MVLRAKTSFFKTRLEKTIITSVTSIDFNLKQFVFEYLLGSLCMEVKYFSELSWLFREPSYVQIIPL